MQDVAFDLNDHRHTPSLARRWQGRCSNEKVFSISKVMLIDSSNYNPILA